MRSTLLVPVCAGLLVASPEAGAGGSPWEGDDPGTSTVIMPYQDFLRLWRAFDARVASEVLRREPPPVVVGAAHYQGKASRGALEVTLTLDVALGKAGEPKRVPLVGEGVVLIDARLVPTGNLAGPNGPAELELVQEGGQHVWVTQQGGDVQLAVRFLVPARGPRGSLEYEIPVLETPVTRLSCEFPEAGLEPRVEGAVDSELVSEPQATRLEATLPPSRTIRIVGFRDLGEGEARETRAYLEGHHLVSLGDGKLELFSVLRYTILYAGTKRFRLEIPAGLEVVSAEGRGAFRYEVVETGGVRMLEGETAFPIRDSFEISLRLERALGEGGERFAVPIPKPLGVEREAGWVAVEVPGRLSLSEVEVTDAVAVDLRQLPAELLTAAVSPILKAYRFHRPGRQLVLEAARLPEHRLDPAAVERVRALSVLGEQGNLLTELRLTLRNRLRRTLALTLAEGAVVQSVLRDGLPVKASRDETGRLLLPLRRSGAGEEAFTLQVVIEERRPEVGLWGRAALALPKLDLPVLSLAWTVWVPAGRHYDLPVGLLPSEVWGQGGWHPGPGGEGGDAAPAEDAAWVEGAAALGGAMPVRIQIPKDAGERLDFERGWLAEGEALALDLPYVAEGLAQGLVLLLPLLMALGGRLLAARRRPWRWLGGSLIATAGFALHTLERPWWWALGLGLALLALGASRGWMPRALGAVRAWARGLPEGYRMRELTVRPMWGWRSAWRALVGVGMAWVALLLLGAGASLVVALW